MAIEPEDITPAGLPRTPLGGYKAGPTQELLKRVAWDYRQLAHDCKQLAQTVDELRQRSTDLEAQLAQRSHSPEEAPDLAELAGNVLAEAQRTANELREAAQAECEAMLAYARAASQEIEAETRRRTDDEDDPDLTELHELRERIRNDLRRTLEAIVALGEGSTDHDTAATSHTVSEGGTSDRPVHA